MGATVTVTVLQVGDGAIRVDDVITSVAVTGKGYHVTFLSFCAVIFLALTFGTVEMGERSWFHKNSMH